MPANRNGREDALPHSLLAGAGSERIVNCSPADDTAIRDTIRNDAISHKILRYDMIRSDSASPFVKTECCQLQTTAIYGRMYSSKRHQRTTLEHRRSAYQHCRCCRCLDTGRPARRQSAGFFEIQGHSAGLL